MAGLAHSALVRSRRCTPGPALSLRLMAGAHRAASARRRRTPMGQGEARPGAGRWLTQHSTGRCVEPARGLLGLRRRLRAFQGGQRSGPGRHAAVGISGVPMRQVFEFPGRFTPIRTSPYMKERFHATTKSTIAGYAITRPRTPRRRPVSSCGCCAICVIGVASTRHESRPTRRRTTRYSSRSNLNVLSAFSQTNGQAVVGDTVGG